MLAVVADEVPFTNAPEHFADAAACRAHLDNLVAESAGYEIVRGPYALADGDVRIHMVKIEGSGHRIWEYRCLGAELASREWRRSMEAEDEEFTAESVARSAEWLKQDVPQQ